ncbi:hypothetical protein [Parafrankia discariae]|uniref:hypothetical protein n=1 Tax=Parafrankia discariae TaxID=365528 RepID=UPI0003741022|nr:hypothetical protein [Parafrankia discariae]
MNTNDIDRAGGRLTFRSYAKAHRHGHVVGLLPGGQPIPFGPYTLTQVGLFIGTLVVLYLTRALWMHFGFVGNLLVLFGLPVGFAFTERFVRPEGRSPLRSVRALAGYAAAPRGGRVRGRSRPTRPRAGRPARAIFVRDLPAPPTPVPSRRGPAPAPAPAGVRSVSVSELLDPPAGAGAGGAR